jgi:hypothetical protein
MERDDALRALKKVAIFLWMAGIAWLVLTTITAQVARSSGFPAGSLSPEMHTVRDGGRSVLETLAPRVPMHRDFIVMWRPDVGSTPAVAALMAPKFER